MKHILLFFIVIYCSITAAQSDELQYNPTRLIIKFTESSQTFKSLREIPLSDFKDKIESVEIVNNQLLNVFFNEYRIVSVSPASRPEAIENKSKDISRIYFLDFINNDDLETVILNLKQSSEIEFVEYDWKGTGGGSQLSPGSLNQNLIIPNDPGFNNQWGFRNTGQNIGGVPGTPGADINITSAWDLTVGNGNTKISVLDSGIPLTASEFSGRILPGYDFANNDYDPTDDLGHGTNVTSIIAAAGNNSIGIGGINWNCKILPIKILNSSNFGYYSWWISGITMAADSGAQVLSMSVGGSSFSQALLDAVNYALNSGSIVVACMMNENNEVTYYPAGFDNVISVGALNNIDNRAVPFCWGGGSNYGNHIDFMAPGDWILGLDYQNPNQTSYWCGTSQATPMVTGLISLMLGLNPSMSLAQIYDLIKITAHDQIGNSSEDTPGWDKYYGWGRIDIYEVINSLVSDVQSENLQLLTFQLSQNFPNPFNPSTYLGFSIPYPSNVQLKIFDILGNEIETLINEEKPAGQYEIEFDATGLASGIYFYRLHTGSFVETKKMILLK